MKGCFFVGLVLFLLFFLQNEGLVRSEVLLSSRSVDIQRQTFSRIIIKQGNKRRFIESRDVSSHNQQQRVLQTPEWNRVPSEEREAMTRQIFVRPENQESVRESQIVRSENRFHQEESRKSLGVDGLSRVTPGGQERLVSSRPPSLFRFEADTHMVRELSKAQQRKGTRMEIRRDRIKNLGTRAQERRMENEERRCLGRMKNEIKRQIEKRNEEKELPKSDIRVGDSYKQDVSKLVGQEDSVGVQEERQRIIRAELVRSSLRAERMRTARENAAGPRVRNETRRIFRDYSARSNVRDNRREAIRDYPERSVRDESRRVVRAVRGDSASLRDETRQMIKNGLSRVRDETRRLDRDDSVRVRSDNRQAVRVDSTRVRGATESFRNFLDSRIRHMISYEYKRSVGSETRRVMVHEDASATRASRENRRTNMRSLEIKRIVNVLTDAEKSRGFVKERVIIDDPRSYMEHKTIKLELSPKTSAWTSQLTSTMFGGVALILTYIQNSKKLKVE